MIPGLKKISAKDLFYKAVFNSTVGAPLSMIMNILVIPPMASFIHQEPLIGSLILTIPFFIVSTMRQFIIDYFYHKHGIILDPKYYIERFINILRNRP